MVEHSPAYDPLDSLIGRKYGDMLQHGTINREQMSRYKATLAELDAKNSHITETEEARIRFTAAQILQRSAIFDIGSKSSVIDTVQGYLDALSKGERTLEEKMRGPVAEITRLLGGGGGAP